MHKQLTRIVYPTDSGRTVLRTEENWDSNLEAGSVSQDGAGISPRPKDGQTF